MTLAYLLNFEITAETCTIIKPSVRSNINLSACKCLLQTIEIQ